MSWVIFWLYVIGCVLSMIPIGRWFRDNVGDDDDDPIDLMFSAFMGVVLSWFWILLVPGWFVYRSLQRPARK